MQGCVRLRQILFYFKISVTPTTSLTSQVEGGLISLHKVNNPKEQQRTVVEPQLQKNIIIK